MKKVIPMNGLIDRDSETMYVKVDEGSVRNRVNGRVMSVDGEDKMANVPLLGTTEIGLSLPLGENIEVGSATDVENNATISFIYNSNDDHGIYRYSKDGGVVTTILENQSILNFSASSIIDAKVIGGFLIWTDNINEPRSVNIQRAINFTSGASVPFDEIYSAIDADTLRFAVRSPLDQPAVTPSTDSSRVYNNLLGKTFQFSIQYIYKDYEYSVLSPYSEIFVSPTIFSSPESTYPDESLANNVLVEFDVGNGEVREVRVLAREDNSGNWFVAGDYKKNGTEADFSMKSFAFYDDRAREFLSREESLLLYYDVPRLAKNLEIPQNRVVLSNLLIGYDQETVNYNLTLGYETVNATSGSVPIVAIENKPTTPADTLVDFNLDFQIPVTLNEGDILTIDYLLDYWMDDIFDGGTQIRFSASFATSITLGASETQTTVINQLISDFNDQLGTHIGYDLSDHPSYTTAFAPSLFDAGGSDLRFRVTYEDAWTDDAIDKIDLDNFSNITQVPVGANTFKSFSSYNVGVVYSDDIGRTSGVLLGSSAVKYIPGFNERDPSDEGKSVFMNWELLGSPPSWATKYRFVVSESINLLSVFPSYTPKTLYNTLIEGRQMIAINLLGKLGYVFNEGDTMVYDDSGTTEVKTILGQQSLILDSDASEAERSGNFILIAKDSTTLLSLEEIQYYIHRPKKEVSEVVYYEDYNTYDVVGGAHSVTTGELRNGDAWIVQRRYEYVDVTIQTVDIFAEDFVINTEFNVRSYSKGRPAIVLSDFGEKRIQDAKWGGQFFRGTKINELQSFLPLSAQSFNEAFGEINGMVLVGDVLKFVQDKKETSVYVNKQTISNADGTLTLVQTDNFLGNVNVLLEDYGTKYKSSVLPNDRNLYYWDGERGAVIRSSPNQQFPISSYGMTSYFLEKKREIDTALDLGQDVDVLFGFDDRYRELLVTFNINDNIETWAFSEELNGWIGQFQFDTNSKSPDGYSTIGERLYSFIDGKLFEHNVNTLRNTIYGENKAFSLQGIHNVSPVNEKQLQSLVMDSESTFNVLIETPIASTRPFGYITRINEATWRAREGKYYAPVLRNINTTAGEDSALYYKGDRMVGRYAFLTFSKTTTDKFELRDVTIEYLIVG